MDSSSSFLQIILRFRSEGGLLLEQHQQMGWKCLCEGYTVKKLISGMDVPFSRTWERQEGSVLQYLTDEVSSLSSLEIPE